MWNCVYVYKCRTVVRNDFWHFADPLKMSFNNATDIRDVEGVLWFFGVNSLFNNIHLVYAVVEDVYLVEIEHRKHFCFYRENIQLVVFRIYRGSYKVRKVK